MTEEKKKLTRSKNDRWLAGVCGGIAEYFDLDGTLIRVLFILFGFAVGGGILIYIILWIIMPEAADTAAGEMVDELKAEEQAPAEEPEEPTEEDSGA
jgi:phage shock protein PspC (stress-responsive transcriptional regulator)